MRYVILRACPTSSGTGTGFERRRPVRDFLSDVYTLFGLCYFEKSTYCECAMKVFAYLKVSVLVPISLKTQARLARPQGVTHILSLYPRSLTMALHDCLLSACSSHALMHVHDVYM